MATQLPQFDLLPSSGTPIYRQIVEQANALIAGGQIAPGSLLPSVRQVAKACDVNPMTVSKAYSLMETQGSVERVRGQGMRVLPPDQSASVADRQQQLRAQLQPAMYRAAQLGLTKDEVREVTESLLNTLPLKDLIHDKS